MGIFDGADCEPPPTGSQCDPAWGQEKKRLGPRCPRPPQIGKNACDRLKKGRASEPRADRRRNAEAATNGSPGYIDHLTASKPLRIGNGVALSKTRRRKAKLWPEISTNLSVQTINGGGTMIIAAAIAITLLSAVLYGMNETFDSL